MSKLKYLLFFFLTSCSLPYLTNTKGNSRLDVLNFVTLVHAFRSVQRIMLATGRHPGGFGQKIYSKSLKKPGDQR